MHGFLPNGLRLPCVALIMMIGVSSFIHAQNVDTWKDKFGQANTWLLQRELDSAKLAFDWVLDEAREAQDICWQSRILNRLSDWAQKSNKLPLASRYASQSLSFARLCPNKTLLVASLVQAGGVQFRRNEYESALSLILEGDSTAQILDKPSLRMPVFFYLGQIYLNQQKEIEAIKITKEGLAISTAIGDSSSSVNFITLLVKTYGQIYEEGSRDSLAIGLDLYTKAIENGLEKTTPSKSRALRLFLGEYYHSIIGVDSCLAAVQYVIQQADDRQATYAHKVESELWLQKENAPKAIASARHSLELSNQLGLLELQSSAHKVLHEAQALSGDYVQAYASFMEYKKLEDSLLIQRSDERVYNLQVKYKTEQISQKEAAGRKKNELLRRTNVLVLVVLALLVAIVLFGLWTLFRLRRKNAIISEQRSSLERANEAKNQLFAILAHDLRGPFISFQGLTQKLAWLQKKGDPGAMAKVTDHIGQTARKLNELLDNLLAWAIQQREGEDYPPQAISIYKEIEDQRNDFQPALESKSIELGNYVPPTMFVWIASPAIATLLRNLISNAVKFSPEGGKVICTIAARNDEWTTLRITDEGPGVPEALRASLFSLAPTKSQPGSYGEKGVGLGLSLCKELAEASGGKIVLDPDHISGAAFKLTLPSYLPEEPQTA